MRKFSMVTTFNDAGFDLYGKRMIEDFDKHWDPKIDLYVYYEGKHPPYNSPRIHYLDLHESCPELVAFKNKFKDDPIANGLMGVSPNGIQRPQHVRKKFIATDSFLFDAVRFSHKVFAILHAAENLTDTDVMIWMDADIITFAPVSWDFINSYTPEHAYTCCLLRDNAYSECGFVSYNLKHPGNSMFMNEWKQMYTNEHVFKLKEWHDSFVYDHIRKLLENEGRIMTHNYSGPYSNTRHPFVNCDLGNFMDHLKGSRKQTGSSKKLDLKRPRAEEHWMKAK